jgi:hypothetical protein
MRAAPAVDIRNAQGRIDDMVLKLELRYDLQNAVSELERHLALAI